MSKVEKIMKVYEKCSYILYINKIVHAICIDINSLQPHLVIEIEGEILEMIVLSQRENEFHRTMGER